jgi:hypothetical protein
MAINFLLINVLNANIVTNSKTASTPASTTSQGGGLQQYPAFNRFANAGVKVQQPPLFCPPVMSLHGISTFFINSGPLSPEAAAIRAQIAALVNQSNGANPTIPTNSRPAGGDGGVTASGSYAEKLLEPRTTAFDGSDTSLLASDIVVYMDALPDADADDIVLSACKATGDSLRAWFAAKPKRDVIVDGRALSMVVKDAMTAAGQLELKNMWMQLATRAGGLLFLGHGKGRQACLSTVLSQVGLSPVKPDIGASDIAATAVANECRYPLSICGSY